MRTLCLFIDLKSTSYPMPTSLLIANFGMMWSKTLYTYFRAWCRWCGIMGTFWLVWWLLGWRGELSRMFIGAVSWGISLQISMLCLNKALPILAYIWRWHGKFLAYFGASFYIWEDVIGWLMKTWRGSACMNPIREDELETPHIFGVTL